VCLEIARADGLTDFCLIPAAEDGFEAEAAGQSFAVKGAVGFVTVGPAGVVHAALCQGTSISFGSQHFSLTMKHPTDFIELDGSKVVSGNADDIASLKK